MSRAPAAPCWDVPLPVLGDHRVPRAMLEDEPVGAEPPQVPVPSTPVLPSGAGESPCSCIPQKGSAGRHMSPLPQGAWGFCAPQGAPSLRDGDNARAGEDRWPHGTHTGQAAQLKGGTLLWEGAALMWCRAWWGGHTPQRRGPWGDQGPQVLPLCENLPPGLRHGAAAWGRVTPQCTGTCGRCQQRAGVGGVREPGELDRGGWKC